MLRPRLISGLLLSLALIVRTEAWAQWQQGDVWGIVVDGQGRPIEGLVVVMFHPQIGWSQPRVTDARGEYRFLGIPIPPRDQFLMEVHWGQQLMFRQTVLKLGPQPVIRLR